MRCHRSKILRDPIRVPTLSLRRRAPFMHIKRKEGLKIVQMGDYVRQRVTHMTSIIVPIFFSSIWGFSQRFTQTFRPGLSQVWSPSLRFQLNKLYNYTRSRNHNNSRGFSLTKHEELFLVFFAYFSQFNLELYWLQQLMMMQNSLPLQARLREEVQYLSR